MDIQGDRELPELLIIVSQEWENARTHLAKAIETYVGATTALAATAVTCPLWKLRSPTIALESELKSLSLGLLNLAKARTVLASTRNAQCSPISRLPLELLASVFRLVVDAAHPRNIANSAGYTSPAVVLAQVCSRWRGVALETGSLWSCIVLSYENCKSHKSVSASAQIQLERTHGSPIDMFLSRGLFYPLNVGSDDDPDVYIEPDFQSTPDLIKPYMKQLCSLTVELYHRDHIESVIECLLEYGAAGSLYRLEIFGSFSPLLFDQANSQILGRLSEHLRSVRILGLHGVRFDWKCVAFEQLDELVLDNLHSSKCPNLAQLVEALSASPGLRRLTLMRITIHDGMEFEVRSPLKLEHLESLVLDRLDDEGVQRLFSVISLGRQELSLVANFNLNNPKVFKAFRLFACTANIGKFRFASLPNHPSLQNILEYLPSLKSLALCQLKLSGSDFDALTYRNTPPASLLSPRSQTNRTGPPAKITELELVNCTIMSSQAMFKETASNLSLDYLHMSRCSVKFGEELHGDTSTTASLHLNATTELAIWLTENLTGKVTIE